MRRSLVSAALAACLAVGFCAPSQIHSAFAGLDAAGTSNGFSVSWATPNATETSQLWYGLTPSSLTQFVNGYTVSYFPVRACGLPWASVAWLGARVVLVCPVLCLQPEVHHHAVVSGLQPATTYYYKVGDAVDGYSEVFTFTVAPNYATQSFNVVG
jgi:Purple acid Phosphatase, N-terminal domain